MFLRCISLRLALSIFFLPCALLVLSGGGHTNAQQATSLVPTEPQVRLTPAQASVFTDALNTLSAQAHVAFVAEGRPLHPAWLANVAPGLPWQDAPLSEVVEKLASAYDYDVQRKGKIFLLFKRYSNPEDLPAVTLSECLQSLQDVKRVTSVINPHLQPSRRINDLLLTGLLPTLTIEQLTAMKHQGLPVSSLRPQQQQMAWQLMCYYYVQSSVDDATLILPDLQAAVGGTTAFRWGEMSGLRQLGYQFQLFGYDVPPVGQPSSFRPLSSPYHLFSYPPAGGTIFMTAVNSHPATYRKPDGTPFPDNDPTAPLADRPSVSTIGRSALADQSLGTVVARLDAKRDGTPTMMVDPILQAKPITVVGEANATSSNILQALADVYGLRVRTNTDGTQLLTRRLFYIPQNAGELPGAMRQIFPAPFVRALHIDALDGIQARYDLAIRRQINTLSEQHVASPRIGATNIGEAGPAVDQTRQQQPKMDESRRGEAPSPEQLAATVRAYGDLIQERSRQTRQIEDMLPKMRNAAVRRLRTDIEPRLKTAPDGRLPVSTVDEVDRQALAAVFFSQSLSNLRGLLSRRVPTYVAYFPQVILEGGIIDEGGKKYFEVRPIAPHVPGKESTGETFQVGVLLPN